MAFFQKEHETLFVKLPDLLFFVVNAEENEFTNNKKIKYLRIKKSTYKRFVFLICFGFKK